MTSQVTATVVGGMFRPDENVEMPELTRVRLTIEPMLEPVDPVAAWESLKARLRERPIHGLGRHFTRDELHERR